VVRDIVLRDPRGGWWRVDVPTAMRERMHGLCGRDRMEPEHAFLLPWTRSVHTFGMRFPLSVALLDDQLRVVAVRTVGPGRIVLPRRGVRHVLECGAGADFRPGDVLRLGVWRSRKDEADQSGDRHGAQGQRDRKAQDGPAGPGRKGYRFPSRWVGRDDPQELQQRPHTTSSAKDVLA
jgi:hypothetical protein